MSTLSQFKVSGTIYDLEDTTARTTANEALNKAETNENAITSLETDVSNAQASASTALTSASEAKALANTAQTTAEQAQASADERQPYLGETLEVICPPSGSGTFNTEDLKNLTNVILNETESDIKINILIQSSPITTYEPLGIVKLWQENGEYKMDSAQVSPKITLILNGNQMKITNSTTEEKCIVFIPMGFSRK